MPFPGGVHESVKIIILHSCTTLPIRLISIHFLLVLDGDQMAIGGHTVWTINVNLAFNQRCPQRWRVQEEKTLASQGSKTLAIWERALGLKEATIGSYRSSGQHLELWTTKATEVAPPMRPLKTKSAQNVWPEHKVPMGQWTSEKNWKLHLRWQRVFAGDGGGGYDTRT